MPLAAHGREFAGEPAGPTHASAKDSRPIYRCEDVEVDPSRGCLKRGGLEQHLRQQSFHLLLYMLERRQRLISKEELIENVWQGAAVTDNSKGIRRRSTRTAFHPDDS
jgi:DNA-binding winged helix-turn-helix (wHTH) protein